MQGVAVTDTALLVTDLAADLLCLRPEFRVGIEGIAVEAIPDLRRVFILKFELLFTVGVRDVEG